jgi:ribosomal protein L16/L10AE
MALSFGKSVSRAALVKADQTLYLIGVKTPKQEVAARKLIASCKARLACKVSTRTEKTIAKTD